MSKRKTGSSEANAKRPVDDLANAVAALAAGEVIVFPTETFYGLGAEALNGDAVAKVTQLKGRDPQYPIPLIVADRRMLELVVAEIPPLAERFMECFWPGPLTLVMPGREGLPPALKNATGGVGVRISSHPLARALTEALGRPMTATSANPSGMEPARSADQAQTYFSGRLEVFMDAGQLDGKKGSTVVQVYPDGVEVIREGEISLLELAGLHAFGS